MKLEVAEFIKFEVSLEEIINACRLILQHTNDQEVRTALNTMFSELKGRRLLDKGGPCSTVRD
jgi:hypothetical protein